MVKPALAAAVDDVCQQHHGGIGVVGHGGALVELEEVHLTGVMAHVPSISAIDFADSTYMLPLFLFMYLRPL